MELDSFEQAVMVASEKDPAGHGKQTDDDKAPATRERSVLNLNHDPGPWETAKHVPDTG